MAMKIRGGKMLPVSNGAELDALYTALRVLLSHTPKTILVARRAGPGWTEKVAQIDREIQALAKEVLAVKDNQF